MRGGAIAVIDFVAKGRAPGEWTMVLVEIGPWAGSLDDHLLRVQGRLYGCVDAVLGGQLAARFPESKGGRITVRMDCHDVPRAEVEDLFHRFSSVLSLDDYKRSLEQGEFASSIRFEISFEGNG